MHLDALTKAAIRHTSHCLLGCSIGEILGMSISTALHWSNLANIVLSIVLAFFFGYLLTFRSLYKEGTSGSNAIKATIATDTTSITSMEIIDNGFIIIVPGAISASLDSSLFWLSLFASLAAAFVVTVPVNRWFIARNGTHHH